MRIVFVETPSPWLVRKNAQVALGSLYLATVLKKERHEVRVARPKEMKDFLEYGDTDIICMSGTTLEYPMIEDCARWIKRVFPGMKIFLGGPHATAMYKEISEKRIFDAICIGEGEKTILDMVRDAENDNLGRIYFGEPTDDLDSIPIPDRSLIEGSHGGDVFAYNQNYIGQGNENFITSRGCSFNCAFCASESMWHRKVRYRSIKNIKAEIEYILETSGIKQIRICDDNMTSNQKRCLELCRALKEFNIAWRCSARADSMTPEISEVMVEAGCKEISPGIESGDQRVLDFLNKKTTIEEMREGCKNAKQAGLTVRALFMIGTPGEHPDTPEINRDYIGELDFDMLSMTTFVPLPGSSIWNNPDKYNCMILSKDFRKYNAVYWIIENGEKVKKEYEPLIHNKALTIDQMKDNVRRMETYVEETGKYNQG